MTLRIDAKYPFHRAYVVKLSCDATPAALSGLVENVVSGRHTEFMSSSELFQWLAAELLADNLPPATESS